MYGVALKIKVYKSGVEIYNIGSVGCFVYK